MGWSHIDSINVAGRILVPKQAKEWDVETFKPAGRTGQ
ncbi:hypothetical protein ALQ72_05414 [Pseudomonas syringae pv. maculicola]|nr:hypothetical protein ALQ72_05414 [Pseudomonas syringae pv. maculicola]RMM86251.1 hypothetical protein ALQ71_02623 [Pseudomonas coronafaciens pv. striafaciens]